MEQISPPNLETQKIHLSLMNSIHSDYPLNQGIHQLIEEQVNKTPDSIAVICEIHSLTYDQLNKKANQLARYLISKGINPKMPVAILMDRSINCLISIISIIKLELITCQ